MLMVSLETQRKSSPQTAVSCQRGQRAGGGGGGGGGGCVENLIRLHILQELHSSCYEIGYILRCTGFVISSIVNKISSYGYIARAAHYVRAVF